MDPKLLEQREMAATRHDQALNRWPNRDNPEFIIELETVVESLKDIISDSDASENDRLEISRTNMYLGMAYFDLAMAYSGVNPELKEKYFTESAITYSQAEKYLLGIGDPVFAAKLNLNYGNTLRGLSEGEDVSLLSAAKERYKLALKTFQSHAPKFISQVTDYLRTIEPQINLAKLKDQVGERVDRLQDLQNKIRKAGQAKELLPEKEIREKLNKINEDGLNIDNIVGEISNEAEGFLKEFSHLRSQEEASIIKNQIEGLNKLVEDKIPLNPEPKDESTKLIFKLLVQRFEMEIESGKVSDLRQESLKQVLDDLKDLVDNEPEELDEMMDWNSSIRALAKTIVYMLKKPSIGKPEPPQNSRAAKVLKNWSRLKTNLFLGLNQSNLGEEERKYGYDLMAKCSKAEHYLYDSGENDRKTIEAECELLRPLGLEIREFIIRRHLMIIFPFWELTSVPVQPNSIFYSGGDQNRKIIKDICENRNLEMLPQPLGDNFSQIRWDQLRSSNAAVFSPFLGDRNEVAAVCYELGIARTLGKSVVILRNQADPLPFDIDVTPVVLNSSSHNKQECSDALDRALFVGPKAAHNCTLENTLNFINKRYDAGNEKFEIRKTLEFIHEAENDPIQMKNRIKTLFTYLSSETAMMTTPAWHPRYPGSNKPRCFHVMPFSESWFQKVTDIARKACEKSGIQYIRGDEASDPNIIRSIWEEICNATHLIVDLTNFNPNVSLELGIAHTLGKKILILGQSDTVDNLFPMLAKTRILPYHLEDNGKELSNNIEKFFNDQI